MLHVGQEGCVLATLGFADTTNGTLDSRAVPVWCLGTRVVEAFHPYYEYITD